MANRGQAIEILDENNNILYPRTNANNVYFGDTGKMVGTVLGDAITDIGNLQTKTNNLDTEVSEARNSPTTNYPNLKTRLDDMDNRIGQGGGGGNLQEVVDARNDAISQPPVNHPTLGDRLDSMQQVINTNNQDIDNINVSLERLDKYVVNIDKYSHLTEEHNGLKVWDKAFQQAFDDLPNSGILIIPKEDYYIKQRIRLENKDGITILCGGTLKPLNGQTALIGTLRLKNITNSTIQSLKFDGNKDNINPPHAIGMESLIEMNDCSNMIFNNLSAKNVSSIVLNSNGGLRNIVFNNVDIKNIGEHGFYFGGNGASNVRFNNFYCEDIGTSNINATRSVACIKFRNKVNTDTLHDNIVIDGFKFVMNTPPIATYDRQLVHAYDVKNITIKNGEVIGEDASLFATNTTLDNMTIDSVTLDCRRVCYGINKKTGWDAPIEIQNPSKFNIRIFNSTLYAYNDYTTDIAMYYNCLIDFKDSQYRTTMATEVNLDTTFESCTIKLGDGRFNLSLTNAFEVKFSNVKFDYPIGRTQPLFTVTAGDTSILRFSRVEALVDTNSFCRGGSNVNLYFHDSVINASLANDATGKYEELYVTNTKFKGYVLDAITKKLFPNNIMHLDGSRKDFKIYRNYLDTNENEVRVDLTFQRCSYIKKENVMITNDDGMRFTYSIENGRVVVITPNRRVDETCTTFTIIYAYQA